MRALAQHAALADQATQCTGGREVDGGHPGGLVAGIGTVQREGVNRLGGAGAMGA